MLMVVIMKVLFARMMKKWMKTSEMLVYTTGCQRTSWKRIYQE